ncbi:MULTISPECIES: type VII secretion protein EccB [unclassified Nocardioides]|uniref:type VII secretion protein EccB n=1 Tax=unclassified Nocardioides TaxID=2615069 RepID=UPI0011536F6E|nr:MULTISPECIES: type VII secretion protein EccB [unclassified Nocardioides]TQK73246.1 type VII secretion protein EccB [Nocardioides sp. SLBN-35]WGY02517.1 type VII secretion protein EccB [Nocardioides sp. QY071]
MATKKDLVEAYSFSRRRLVTAFVSGAPGGREVEPARPGRMIVGGIALAVLLVAGAAIAGALSDRAEVDWKKPGLVADDRGALYVILDEDAVPGQPRVRPVINVTSAQLILGASVEARKVPDDEIAGVRKGQPIGILDAPATVPAVKNLDESGWTSCTGTGLGMQTAVSALPGVRQVPTDGFVVKSAEDGKVFLIAEADVPGVPRRAYRYLLPDNQPLFVELGISPNDEITVPDAWLELFPPGDPLDATGLGIDGVGQPAVAPGYDGARVGDWVQANNKTYAFTAEGFLELTPFAAAVLRTTSFGKKQPTEIPYVAGAAFDFAPASTDAREFWPEKVLSRSLPATEQACAQLVTAKGEPAAARLATAPQGDASAEGVSPGDREVTVASGQGAVIRSADWISSDEGTIHLIDDRGYSYPVASTFDLEQLGYAKVPVIVVPDVWNKLFEDGPELSQDAALCPPSKDQSCG